MLSYEIKERFEKSIQNDIDCYGKVNALKKQTINEFFEYLPEVEKIEKENDKLIEIVKSVGGILYTCIKLLSGSTFARKL
jgi:hypothetical protein